MTTYVSSSYKRCGTCEYWTGPRIPKRGRDVEFKDSTVTGTCIGAWKGSEYVQSHSCSHWRKWAVLE